MGREQEPIQTALFASDFIEPDAEARRVLPAEFPPADVLPSSTPTAEQTVAEIEPPRATLREIKAARSLLYNQLLLEVVQRRIEKAEFIVLGFLLTQVESQAQMGPYLVEADADNHLTITKTEDEDGWFQLYFNDLDAKTPE